MVYILFPPFCVLPLPVCFAFKPFVDKVYGRDEEQVGSHPGRGVAVAHAEEAERRYQPEAHSAARYHLHDARQHWKVGEPEALQAVSQDG